MEEEIIKDMLKDQPCDLELLETFRNKHWDRACYMLLSGMYVDVNVLADALATLMIIYMRAEANGEFKEHRVIH